MSIFSNIFSRKKRELTIEEVQLRASLAAMKREAGATLAYSGPIREVDWDGENTFGEVGIMKSIRPNYNGLRIRSWQAYHESDIAQIVINTHLYWVLGTGLKLQVEPLKVILEAEGIAFDPEKKRKFAELVEARYHLYCKSKKADHSGMITSHKIAWLAELNGLVGGDVLIIRRLVKGQITTQLIDGAFVQSPEFGTEWFPKELANGHRIIDGVEVDRTGKHIAFYVKTYAVTGDVRDLHSYSFERIEAYGKKSGLQMAQLYAPLPGRLGSVRGMPLLSVVIEKAKQIDDYAAATLNQAKNAANISYFLKHEKDAPGKNAFSASSVVEAFDTGDGNSIPNTADGVPVYKNVKIDTIGTAYNLPPGAEIKTLENKNTLYIRDFFELRRDALFAVCAVPPDVAMKSYNASFSASRAAVGDWKHSLMVKRDIHIEGFRKPDYDFWFEINVLQNKIQAPGYLLQGGDVAEAYRNARFNGPQPPHVDPEKEVRAARLKLGTAAAHLPINELESITEEHGGGNSQENIEQLGRELEAAEKAGIVAPLNGTQNQVTNGDKSTD